MNIEEIRLTPEEKLDGVNFDDVANTATDKAIRMIEEMIESYNSIDFPYGAEFKVAILQALKSLIGEK